jgi:hypothetical protein
MMGSIRPSHEGEWLTASPGVGRLAQEVIGTDDPLAAQWLLRVTLALWYWPAGDRDVEYALVKRFVGPSFSYGKQPKPRGLPRSAPGGI